MPQNVGIKTIKMFMVEIKQKQQFLRLRDTPILQAFLQSAAELERRGTMGVGTSWRTALKGNPQIFFFWKILLRVLDKRTKIIEIT